jgi:hypothetical protein
MTTNESTVRSHVQEFKQQFRQSQEPNRTLLDVIGRATREEDWQRLLAYFLRPANSHGFEDAILEAFIRTVEAETEISGLRGPLDSVRVDVEVQTASQDRVDLLLTQADEWFLCVELKVNAAEHGTQTVSYVETDYIGTRSKGDFPPDGHHYLYLTADGDDQPTANAFEHLTWTAVADEWQSVLDRHQNGDGSYPNRGAAQFAEFLTTVRTEAGEPLSGKESYFRSIPNAKRAYEKLSRSLGTELKRGVRDRTRNGAALRIRTQPTRSFPNFERPKDRVEVDKPLWQVGRNKPTILYEINFHLQPGQGPGETSHRPSVGVNLDIRGGSKLKQSLREGFKNQVSADRYRPLGFGQPHANTKWHFLSKEVLLDDTDTPVSDVLDAFDVLYGFESTLDELARSH